MGKKKRIVGIISEIAASLMLAVSGILFALSCYSIYTSAEKSMFTYEKIGAAFNKIDIFVYISLIFVVFACVWAFVFPAEGEKLRAPKRAKSVWLRLAPRVELADLPENEKKSISAERKLRKTLLLIFYIALAVTVVIALAFLLNPKTFPAEQGEYNAEVIEAFLYCLLIVSPITAYGAACFFLLGRSYLTECELLKAAIKSGASAPADNTAETSSVRAFFSTNEAPITLGLRIAFIGCGVLFIILGIFNGGVSDVLVKAVNICAECIGLG